MEVLLFVKRLTDKGNGYAADGTMCTSIETTANLKE
jgi:hypothetical protein